MVLQELLRIEWIEKVKNEEMKGKFIEDDY